MEQLPGRSGVGRGGERRSLCWEWVRDGSDIHWANRLLAKLTTPNTVGTIANMRATLITRSKTVLAKGEIVELVVWRVPAPVPPSRHAFKYRAAYIVAGQRVVGFDNERGKGDHMHVGDKEQAYAFTTVDQLVEDFIAAVDAVRRTT